MGHINRNGVIAIVVTCAVVVTLALGLGLGFGLPDNSADVNPPAASKCYDSLQYNSQDNYDATIPWNRQCSTPNVPKCPNGIKPPLIVISLDGFRAEYLTRNVTPTMTRLSECGVQAPYVRATYPTKTFPNHYTIATGLYPESHGIISNSMYDTNLDEEFRLGNENSVKAHWWSGEPIWNTVVKAGRKAVTLFWPGSEAPIQDIRPSHCYNYNEDLLFEDRVNEIMGYFNSKPEEYPDLLMFYLHEPDNAGHNVGPYGSGISGNLTNVDHIIQLLMSGLQQKDLDQCVNVMVVSDHGMDNIDCDRTVDLLPFYGDVLDDLYIYDGDEVRITSKYVENGGVYEQRPNGATAEEIMERVKCTNYNETKDWYVRFDKKEDLPKRFHYSNNMRIEEVVGDIQAQWLVFKDADSEPWYACTGGDHGYDPAYDSMHAIFLGSGPGFMPGDINLSFDIIELYNLMTDLLELAEPAPNNGTPGALHNMLSTSTPLADPDPPRGVYTECQYPADTDEQGLRRNSTTTCNWIDIKNFTTTPVSTVDGQLDLDGAAQNKSISDHLSLGVPEVDFSDANVCRLIQKDYVMGYSHQHHMPLWSAFKLNKNPDCTLPDTSCYKSDDAVPDLIRPDIRLSVDQQTECNMYTNTSLDVRPHFLFPPSLINMSSNADQGFDAHISTNVVPMYEGFRTGVWQEVLFLLEEYSAKFESINVVVGPIFDYNADGKRDDIADIEMYVRDGVVPLPTHYYVVVSRCPTAGTPLLACATETIILSLVLSHKPYTTNCWDRRYFDYIERNVARVRDIELLTDLRLHTLVEEQRRLHMSVSLSESLWPVMGWMDLTGGAGESCPGVGTATNCPAGYNAAQPPLLLISIDGFRPDYADRGLTPTITKLRDCGSSAEYMRSIYPTYTFPNHYTITSGLYPESHGIVDNNMYDMQLLEDFWLGGPNMMNPEWWTGDPLWNNVERNNKTAVTLFWPGSDVEIGGMRPTDYYTYNGDMPYGLRVSTVLDWLENGVAGKKPDFITLYFSNVDHIGHEAGPDSLMLSEALIGMDDYIKDLMDGIYKLGLHQCINVIVVSDHGMTDISCDMNVILNDYIDMSSLLNKTYLYYGAASRMSNKYYRDKNYNYHHLKPEDQVPKESIINNLTCDTGNMNVFDKVDLPKRHHFANNDRIDDITFITAESWLVDSFSPWCAILGQHGWDPYFQTMKAYFSAYGPGFQEELVSEPFENIELYNVMNYLLGISPSDNNGTAGSLYHLLKNPPALNNPSPLPYTPCLYPEDDDDYDRRANLSTSMCTCTPPAGETIEQLDQRLNFTSSSSANKEIEHIPHGLPHLLNNSICVIHNDKFVSGYDQTKMSVTWTAFTLTGAQFPAPNQPDCLRPDVRLEQSEQVLCSDYQVAGPDIISGFLFPPAWIGVDVDQMDAVILTNSVPMYQTFWAGIWQRLLNKLSQWATNHIIHVVTGPIYDYDANGGADHEFYNLINDRVPVPSHFYAIVLRCPSGDCISNMAYEALSFILPHKRNITNCVTENAYLLDNTARIRDIELLTGIQFLTTNITLDSIRTRTFIPTALWDTT